MRHNGERIDKQSGPEPLPAKERNWAGNYEYRAARVHYPETVEQVRELVARCRKLKVLGTRHSFNDIADSAEDLISLQKLDRFVSVDSAARTVTVDGGIRYGDLCRELYRVGFALPTLASLPHISVTGACATATHGSGDSHANLAAAVAAMEIVTPDGDLTVFSRERTPQEFEGAVVHLGGLGIITRLTLDLVPPYDIRQTVFENLPFRAAEAGFEKITGGGYSVSLFTDWQSDRFAQVWRKELATESTTSKKSWFGAAPAAAPLHPIPSLPAENCTAQMGERGPWHERIPHFRYEFTPSSGEELQSEYYVPRSRAMEAFRAVRGMGDRLAPLLQVSEVRTIAGDNLWMSPCYRQPSVSIHFTWVKDWPAVRRLLPLLEERLADFEARPHWGKLFTTPPERLRAIYPKFSEFTALLQTYDPAGKFRNEYLDRCIFSA